MRLQNLSLSLLAAAMVASTGTATLAQEKKESDPTKEQFIPVLTYRSGPFAAGGSGLASGWEDYMALLNLRDGGINGIKLVWEECETGGTRHRCRRRDPGTTSYPSPASCPIKTASSSSESATICSSVRVTSGDSFGGGA